MFGTSKIRVCVTGGAGFIGAEITRHLLRLGHRVTLLDDLSTGARTPVERLGLRFIHGSVLDRRSVASAVRGADLIVHLAGVVGMRLAYDKRELSYQTSTLGTKRVIEAAPGVPIVAASSSAVYGDTNGNAMRESEILDSAAALRYDGGHPGYALGKLHLEDIVKQNAEIALCVRPFNVVGRGQASRYGMVVPTLVERALSGINLNVYDDGLQTRCFSEVETFVATLLGVIPNPESWQLPQRALNIGSATRTTILSLAQEVISHTGSTSEITLVPYATAFPGRRDVRERVPDVALLESITGRIDWPPIQSIIKKMIGRARLVA